MTYRTHTSGITPRSILTIVGVVLLFCVLAAALSPAFAQAPGDTGTLVNIGGPLAAIRDAFLELVATLLFGLAIVVSRWLKAKWNIDTENSIRAIEAKHRETLHWALSTGVAAGLARLGVSDLSQLSIDARHQVVADAIRWARDNGAPEAVLYFKASTDGLAELALSKLAAYLPAPTPVVNVTTTAA